MEASDLGRARWVHNPFGMTRNDACGEWVRAVDALAVAEELERVRQKLSAIEAWKEQGERLMEKSATHGVVFQLGAWWADRPWRIKA